jgi:hypothetical protein
MERLDDVRRHFPGQPSTLASHLIESYDAYLAYMRGPKEELRTKVLDKNWSSEIKAGAYEFGHNVAELLSVLGEGKVLARYIVI